MSPFSARIRDEILAAFPAWSAYAVAETYKNSKPYLVITVPAPHEANTSLPLRISTWDEEVTVDFDHYHSHFPKWNPEDGDDVHNSALLFVQAVLSEEIAVSSWWQGSHCKMSAQLVPGAPLEPHFNIEFNAVRVRSWLGTHNVDHDA